MDLKFFAMATIVAGLGLSGNYDDKVLDTDQLDQI